MTGSSTNESFGGAISVSKSQSIDNTYDNPFTNSWMTTTVSIAFGSKTIVNGSVGVSGTTPPLKIKTKDE